MAERLAGDYLRRRGYKILAINWKKSWGEIDLVVEGGGGVIFVEVKASGNTIAGFEPELRAGFIKLDKVVRTARTYLLQYKYPDDTPWQVDVISVAFDFDRSVAKIKHFKNVDV